MKLISMKTSMPLMQEAGNTLRLQVWLQYFLSEARCFNVMVLQWESVICLFVTGSYFFQHTVRVQQKKEGSVSWRVWLSRGHGLVD